MMDRSSPGTALLLGALVLALPRLASAQSDDASRATARDLATAGVEAYQRGRADEASSKLEKAYRILRVPSIGLWSARALVKQGKLVQASERYREVVRLDASVGDSSVQKAAQADAARELDELTPRLPRVVVRLQGASAEDVTIEVDGVALASVLVGESRPVDPGTHRFEAKRGSDVASASATVQEGEATEVLLRFEAKEGGAVAESTRAVAASDAAPGKTSLGTQRTLALVSGGVGLVGVGLGSFFGLRAKSKLDDANAAGCDKTCSTQRGHEANEDAIAAGNVATIAFVVGAVALTGGVVLWLTAKPTAEPGVAVGMDLSGVRMRAIW
jgi:hypothetical protein